MLKWLSRFLKKLVSRKMALNGLRAFEPPLYINGFSQFNGNTWLGKNCHFNGISVRGSGKVTIGSNFHSGPECIIISEIHDYRGNALPYDEKMLPQDVVIGDNVWIGTRVMILGGVNIGEGVIIQAGSVVVSDIPPLSIAGGHPARIFSSRDAAHYEDLKAKGRFY